MSLQDIDRPLRPDELPFCVLDVLRYDDVENLASILRMLNSEGCIGWREFWRRDFTESEVLEAIRGLDAGGLIRSLQESTTEDNLSELPSQSVELKTDPKRLWFALTPAGREKWEAWNAPVSTADADAP